MYDFEEKWIMDSPRFHPTLIDMLMTAKTLLMSFSSTLTAVYNSINFATEFEQVFGHSRWTLLKQHFHHICLPEKDIYSTLYQMGFIYTTQIQSQPYPHANLSIFPYLFCSTVSFLSLWKSSLLNAVLLGSFQAFTFIYLTHILVFLSFVIVNIFWVIFFFFWQTM